MSFSLDRQRADDILVLGAAEVDALLEGQESEILAIVAEAYRHHALGGSSLPHSLFLRFPGNDRDRIIALPAYLKTTTSEAAGIKWISSFPGNIECGMDRASAIIVLNSMENGRPFAVLEGALISAKRTAASAALAAKELKTAPISGASVIGCGVISLEIVRFLRVVVPELRRLHVFDLQPERALRFRSECEAIFPELVVSVTGSNSEALAVAPLIVFATTSGTPHIHDLSMCQPGAILLHVSLRDLSPEVILGYDNVVDDVDHVCRAQTSVHLAELLCGNRDFVRTTLGDILNQQSAPRRDDRVPVIFSPFGLGILDLALSSYIASVADKSDVGTRVNFFSASSLRRAEKVGASAGSSH